MILVLVRQALVAQAGIVGQAQVIRAQALAGIKMIVVEGLILLGLVCLIYFVGKFAYWAGKQISENAREK